MNHSNTESNDKNILYVPIKTHRRAETRTSSTSFKCSRVCQFQHFSQGGRLGLLFGQLNPQLVPFPLHVRHLHLELCNAVELLLSVLLRGDLVALALQQHVWLDMLAERAGAWVGKASRGRRGRRGLGAGATVAAAGAGDCRVVAVKHAKAGPVMRAAGRGGRFSGQLWRDVGQEGGGGGVSYSLLDLVVESPVEVAGAEGRRQRCRGGNGIKEGARGPPRGV